MGGVLAFLMPFHFAQAQDMLTEAGAQNSWAVSVQVQAISDENGIGASVQTPSYGGWGAFRLGYFQMFKDVVPVGTTIFDEVSYGLVEADYINYFSRPTDPVRGYWGVGLGLILPDDDLSDDSTIAGFDALAGLEVAAAEMPGSLSAFFEVGYLLNTTRAEALPQDPRFANGVTLAGGVRAYF